MIAAPILHQFSLTRHEFHSRLYIDGTLCKTSLISTFTLFSDLFSITTLS